jgi:hypothetical protein
VGLLRNRDGATGRSFALEVVTGTAAAGSPIQGELRGLAEPAEVTLLRIERCPAGELATPVGMCTVVPRDGRGGFELPVPAETPPDLRGPRCRLSFAIRARSPVTGRRRAQVVIPVAMAGGEHKVHESSHLYDRMIASFSARHFHVELADALLEGGGHIEGRVHMRDETPRSVDVIARCDETWRTNFRFRNHRQPPLWRSHSVWRETITLECEPDRRWQPFAFAIPSGLPAAVEGHIICWRYEIEARTRPRVGRAERAVATPLRFDIE